MENTIYKNNSGQEFIITDTFIVDRANSKGVHKKYIIKFLETGHVKEVYAENAKAGKVRDEFHKSVLGIGYLGASSNGEPHWRQARQLWGNMMKRCYNPKDKKGYFGYVTVDPRWHNFSQFSIDIKSLPNFDRWVNSSVTGERWNLDKDFRGDGTVYGFEVCQFITEYENKSAGARATVDMYKRSRGLVQK